MSDINESDIIEKIHASPASFELAITGGGTSALSRLLAVPGASKSILNAVVPYSFAALCQYLGSEPEQACNEKTARLMASRAFQNARQFSEHEVFGIGVTAAIQTNRQRRGSDRLHLAIQSLDELTTFELSLDGELSREQQEHACADYVVTCIAEASGIEQDEAPQEIRRVVADPTWQQVLMGTANLSSQEPVKAIFPGAFNPPHEGHFRMQQMASEKLQCEVAFELSVENVDKADLDYFDLADRQALLRDAPVRFTRAATFVEKSDLLPGVTFVVGIDTLVRIDNDKYYGDSAAEKHKAIELFANRGHKFLVFGRSSGDTFVSLANTELSPALRQICVEVPEDEFRIDLSSTELRAEAEKAQARG